MKSRLRVASLTVTNRTTLGINVLVPSRRGKFFKLQHQFSAILKKPSSNVSFSKLSSCEPKMSNIFRVVVVVKRLGCLSCLSRGEVVVVK